MDASLPKEIKLDDLIIMRLIRRTTDREIHAVKLKEEKLEMIPVVLKSAIKGNDAGVKSMKREIDIITALKKGCPSGSHPNVVLDSVHVPPWNLLIPLANCDLQNLFSQEIWKNDLLAEHPVLRDPVNVCRQLFSAIDFMDQNKIAHLDIKPGNFLLFDGGVIKLTDFGSAETYKEVSERGTAWSGFTKGWAPPEYQALKTFLHNQATNLRRLPKCTESKIEIYNDDRERDMFSLISAPRHKLSMDGSCDVWATARVFLAYLRSTSQNTYYVCDHCNLINSLWFCSNKQELFDDESFTKNFLSALELTDSVREMYKKYPYLTDNKACFSGYTVEEHLTIQEIIELYNQDDKETIISTIKRMTPIIMKALHHDPHKRPTAKQVLEAIKDIKVK